MINEGQKNCAACGVHKQECTYMQDPQPRKRKQEGDTHQGTQVKQRYRDFIPRIPYDVFNKLTSSNDCRNTEHNSSLRNSFGEARTIKQEHEVAIPIARGIGRTNTYPGSNFHTTPNFVFHLDIPSKLEPAIYNVWQPISAPALDQSFHIPERPIPKLVEPIRVDATASILQKLNVLVGTRAASLIRVYKHTVHPSFPVIQDNLLAAIERAGVDGTDTTLLAAIYSVAASLEAPDTPDDTPAPIDIIGLEDLALQLFQNSLSEPTLSTLQAGLLLMHTEAVDPVLHNTQIVELAYELGLQLDCSTWTLTPADRGLRKTLAWAVYMQDTWIALVNSSPPVISGDSWDVQGLEPQDYAADEPNVRPESTAVERGRILYGRMIELTNILSSILDTFYSAAAVQQIEDVAEISSRVILEKAKPIQIRLREWFTKLDPWLKTDAKSMNKPSFSGTSGPNID